MSSLIRTRVARTPFIRTRVAMTPLIRTSVARTPFFRTRTLMIRKRMAKSSLVWKRFHGRI